MSYIKRRKRNGRVYLSEVETKRVDGKVITKHLRYIGREADGKTILSSSLSDLTIDKVKIYGPLLLLNHLAKEIHLSEVLGAYGDELLSLVFAHCLDYKSINQMSRWFERTDLNMLLDIDGLTEDRLLQALDSLEQSDPDILQQRIFDNVQKIYKLEMKGLVYDVTNTYLYGKRCPFGKLGKDKDGIKGRPLIQIGLGVTQKEGVPVFHKVYNGNIHDSRTFQDAITYFEEYKIKDGIFVFDRGITSEKIQEYIKTIKWKVLCGLPKNSILKGLVRNEVNKKNFSLYGNRVRLNSTIFYVIIKSYKIGAVTGKLAICFNEEQKRALKESRYDEISQAQKLLSQKKQIKLGIEKFFSKTGKLLIKRVQEEEEFDGYSFIFTTASLTKEDMVKHYFDKDLVEKAFHSLKGIVRVRPIRHWLYNRVTAHVFICYLSYLLLSLLKLRLEKINISPGAAIRELDSLYKVYMRDSKKGFEVVRVVALNKLQEKILKTVDKELILPN
jgi:transposase